MLDVLLFQGQRKMHGHGTICESLRGLAHTDVHFPTSPRRCGHGPPPWGRCPAIGVTDSTGTTMIHNDSRRITTTRPWRCAEGDQFRAATSSSGSTSVGATIAAKPCPLKQRMNGRWNATASRRSSQSSRAQCMRCEVFLYLHAGELRPWSLPRVFPDRIIWSASARV